MIDKNGLSPFILFLPFFFPREKKEQFELTFCFDLPKFDFFIENEDLKNV